MDVLGQLRSLIAELGHLGLLNFSPVLKDLIQTLTDVCLQFLDRFEPAALAPTRILLHAFSDLAIAGDGGRSVMMDEAIAPSV